MSPHATEWAPGIVVLGIALAVAVLFILSAKKAGAVAARKVTGDDLDERYRALLAALKEHAAAKHLMGPAQWQQEQTRLELAAAAVLREKAGVEHEAHKAQARAEKLAQAQAQAPRNATLRGALIGGGVVAFLAGLFFVLNQETKARVDPPGMPGGSGAQARAPMQPQQDPAQEVERLRKLAEAQPDNIDVLADVAGQMIKLQAFGEAYPIVTRASGLDPYHVQTRIYRVVLEAVDGDALPAIDELEHLGQSYDGAYKARLYAGLLSLETNQPERALKQLEAYLVEAPQAEQPPFVAMSVQQLKAQLRSKEPPTQVP